MLAGVSYKKEYDKVIPKAETNKEIKQPPNIGIRKRRTQNKTPKEPVRQTPKEKEVELYKIQKEKRAYNDGGPHEKVYS